MKRRGTGSNCFDNDELARYYDEYQACARCSKHNATDFHHNIPRSNKHTSSIINAIPLCRECHNDNATFTSPDQQRKFFEWNMKWLLKRQYDIHEKDIDKLYIMEYRDILGV